MPRLINPKRLVSTLTVRARIIAIALIPVAGFLATGAAFVSGENEVAAAFRSVERATALADASREFKSAVGTVKSAAHGFAVRARSSYLQVLEDAQAAATAQFITIRHLTEAAGQSNLDAIERTLARLQRNFSEVRKEYERVGAEKETGIRAKLRDAAGDVERVIDLDMSWLTDNTANQLVASLLSMRRFEAAYMLDRSFDDHLGFVGELGKFNKIIDAVVAAEVLRKSNPGHRAGLCGGLRRLGRIRSRDCAPRRRHRIRHRVSDPQRRRQCPALERAAPARRRGARPVTDADPQHHHRGRAGRRAARAGGRLGDRPQHHPAARRAGPRHAAARRRRYLSEDSGEHGQRTSLEPSRARWWCSATRSSSARNWLPRRPRPAGRASSAELIRRHHRAVRNLGRSGARQGA